MSVTLVWYAKQVLAKVEAQVAKNMDRAAIFMVNDVKTHFGSPRPMPENLQKRTYGGNFRKVRAKEWREMQHSVPGEPPFVQTGHLRRSITWKAPAQLVRLVGSFMPVKKKGKTNYAAALEYGTSRIMARPFLRPSLARCKKAIMKIIATGS